MEEESSPMPHKSQLIVNSFGRTKTDEIQRHEERPKRKRKKRAGTCVSSTISKVYECSATTWSHFGQTS